MLRFNVTVIIGMTLSRFYISYLILMIVSVPQISNKNKKLLLTFFWETP